MTDLDEKQIQNENSNKKQSKNINKKRLINHDENDDIYDYNDNKNDDDYNDNKNDDDYNDKNYNFKIKKKKINNFIEFNDYYKEGDIINRCVECNIDLGPSNPRQLCGKIYCINC